MLQVLFVCTANLCRSPMAAAVFHRQVEQAGLSNTVGVHSAGTHRYRIGEAPDARAVAALKRRGYTPLKGRGRQVTHADLLSSHWVIAMDHHNLRALERICPADLRHRLHLLMRFAPGGSVLAVPDPYAEDELAFDSTLDLIEPACAGLLATVRERIAALERLDSRSAA